MKTTSIRRALVLALAVSATACRRDASTGEAGGAPADPAKASPAVVRHAAAGVKAGSHEDWCEEHQVPESLCTRCNPSLVAAFKATNDWCAEHGLPESQCRICNPNLKIERPPKDGAK
jgi:hypothetical protein